MTNTTAMMTPLDGAQDIFSEEQKREITELVSRILESKQEVLKRAIFKLVGEDKIIDKRTGTEKVCQPYMDLYKVYGILLDTSDGFSSIVMTYDMLERLNITPDEVFAAAEINTQFNFPMHIDSMPNVLMGMMESVDIELPDNLGMMPTMYVISNKTNTNGAAAITYAGALEQIADACGGSYFLLPSSIHEVIAVPAENARSSDELRAMVREVNDTIVDERDILGYSVYFYDSATQELSIA